MNELPVIVVVAGGVDTASKDPRDRRPTTVGKYGLDIGEISIARLPQPDRLLLRQFFPCSCLSATLKDRPCFSEGTAGY